MTSAPDAPSSHLTLQFLAWLDEAPRTYGETMNAWRTSCPRLSIWEDALGDGLVRIENGHGPMRDARVKVTDKGKRMLAAIASFPSPLVGEGAERMRSMKRGG